MANVNLYPPILDTYMPALVEGQSYIDIPITFSNFGSTSAIKEIQIRISNQNNNKFLTNTKYGIIYKKVNRLPQSGSYKIRVSENDDNISFRGLSLNEYGRIQIRFSLVQKGNDEQTYLAQTDNFSEWSSIMLFKKIPSSEAILTQGFSGFTTSTQYLSTLDAITGYIRFNKDTDEYLYNYRVKILDEFNNIIEDSGIKDANFYQYNQFNYNIKSILELNKKYIVTFEYTTNNNYIKKYTSKIIISDKITTSYIKQYIDLDNTVIIPNESKGCLEVRVKFKTGSSYNGNIVIKRASSKFNFNKADDIKFDFINTNELIDDTYIFEDNTIESGIMYKYFIQDMSATQRGEKISLNKDTPVMLELDDIFLMDKDNNLKVRLNSNIPSYKINVKDSILSTIGSRYPFAVRGSENYYKTYSITGLISFEADIVNNILNLPDRQSVMSHKNDEKIVDDNFNLLQEEKIETHLFADLTKLFVSEENVNKFLELINNKERNNFTIERLFRDLAYSFLNNGKAKLFRSPSEGNAIVYLTDVSLSPQSNIMNRLLYSFSATMTEIDECSIDNYSLYDIIDLNAPDFSLSDTKDSIKSYLGQVTLTTGIDLLEALNDKYCNTVNNSVKSTINSIDWIRVDMGNSGGIITINNNSIHLTSKNPYFEVSNIDITSLICNKDAIIDYKITLGQEYVYTEQKVLTRIENKIGQIYETIEGQTSLIQMIKDKISRDNIDNNIELVSVYKIIIETEEPAYFGIQDFSMDSEEGDSIPFSHVTFEDNNGHYILELYDKDSLFNEVIYRGVDTLGAKSKEGIDSMKYLEDNILTNENNPYEDDNIYTISIPDLDGSHMEKDVLILPEGKGNFISYEEEDVESNLTTTNYILSIGSKEIDVYYKDGIFWTLDKLPDLDKEVITKPILIKFTYFYTVGRVE